MYCTAVEGGEGESEGDIDSPRCRGVHVGFCLYYGAGKIVRINRGFRVGFVVPMRGRPCWYCVVILLFLDALFLESDEPQGGEIGIMTKVVVVWSSC